MTIYDLVDVFDGITGGVLMVRREVEYFLVSEHLGWDIAGTDIMPGSDQSLVYDWKVIFLNVTSLEIQPIASSRESICKPGQAVYGFEKTVISVYDKT